jgi:hypothetical protein
MLNKDKGGLNTKAARQTSIVCPALNLVVGLMIHQA